MKICAQDRLALSPAFDDVAAPLSLRRWEWDFLHAIDGEASVAELAERCGLNDDAALDLAYDTIDRGLAFVATMSLTDYRQAVAEAAELAESRSISFSSDAFDFSEAAFEQYGFEPTPAVVEHPAHDEAAEMTALTYDTHGDGEAAAAEHIAPVERAEPEYAVDAERTYDAEPAPPAVDHDTHPIAEHVEHVEQIEHIERAETAERAEEFQHAEEFHHAEFVEHAPYAEEFEHAEHAEHAATAEHDPLAYVAHVGPAFVDVAEHTGDAEHAEPAYDSFETLDEEPVPFEWGFISEPAQASSGLPDGYAPLHVTVSAFDAPSPSGAHDDDGSISLSFSGGDEPHLADPYDAVVTYDAVAASDAVPHGDQPDRSDEPAAAGSLEVQPSAMPVPDSATSHMPLDWKESLPWQEQEALRHAADAQEGLVGAVLRALGVR